MPHAIADSPATLDQVVPGAYVTDGDHLFRVLSVSSRSDAEPLVTFEDCLTLELLVCPFEDLDSGRLGLVRTSPTSASA